MEYFYVGTMLPDLDFDRPAEISFADFSLLLEDNLTRKDFKQTLVVRRYYDLLNLKALWQGEPLSPYGLLDANEINEGLLNQVTFPTYVYDFLDRHESTEDRLKHFPALLSSFFKTEIAKSEGVLHQYLKFERELRLVLTVFRAKKLGRDLNLELQYEDPDEPLIAEFLAQKDAKQFEPPEEFRAISHIFEEASNDPMELQKAIDKFRFDFLESLVDMADLFSIKRILIFMLELLIVERWNGLDPNQGKEILRRFAKSAVNS